MADRKKHNSGSGDGLDEDDRVLWKSFTEDVTPLQGAALCIPEADAPERTLMTSKHVRPHPHALPKVSVNPPQLDGKTESRLRRGKLDIDAVLDLHGLKQAEAHSLLTSFVVSAYRRDLRCLLVITGKDREGDGHATLDEAPVRGVLNRRLREWTGLSPLNAIVLKVTEAAQSHGGRGAFYLYLKRRRSPKG